MYPKASATYRRPDIYLIAGILLLAISSALAFADSRGTSTSLVRGVSQLQSAVSSGTSPESGCGESVASAGAPSSGLWSSWSFECAHPRYKDKALQAKIEALFANIMDTGVARIHRINPALAGILASRLRRIHKFSVTCTYALDDFSGIEADASTDSKLTPQGYDVTMNLHEYYILQVLKKAIEEGKAVPSETQGVLFHELLHVAHLDNQPESIHGQGPIPNPHPGAVTQDLVYACATQAYAAERSTEISPSGQGIYNGPRVCEVCAEGRERTSPTSTGEEFTLATDSASREQASRVCRFVHVQYAPKSTVLPEE